MKKHDEAKALQPAAEGTKDNRSLVGLQVMMRGHLWLALENVVDGPKIHRVEDEGYNDHDHHKFDLRPGAKRRQQPHSNIAELCQERSSERVGQDAAAVTAHRVRRIRRR